jgi:acetylornithine deacetylase
MNSFEVLASLTLNESRYIELLRKLIEVTPFLQNNPQQGLIPNEDKASDIVMEALKPYTQPLGPLKVERVTYVEGRGNLLITYPGVGGDKICSFVGSHLDVVPADPAGWSRDPFKLIVEGDMLYGRGTTDCLGHVALITDLMISLAIHKPVLQTEIAVIFIANEENSEFVGLGVDQLAKEGYIDHLKNGPLFWVDSADSQPCVGTAGVVQWQLDFKGKVFHSGMPHRAINSIEFAQDAISYIQQRFYTDYKTHEL